MTRASAGETIGLTMKMIGLIGGMSWESTAEYYRILNEGARDRNGPTASANCLLWSFDFSDIERLQHAGDWPELTHRLCTAARRLESAGAELIVICTNTMHRMANEVQSAVAIPLLHIADPTARQIKAARLRRVGLLGTAFTMEQRFYKGRLTEHHGLDIIVPPPPDRAVIHQIIYSELVAGIVTPNSRIVFRQIIAALIDEGAEAIILGCTEIMLLVKPEDSAVPLFDTTTLHARAALDFAIAPGPPSRPDPFGPME